MRFTALVPARMTSTRLPRKPLADICGKPMVVRTAERALASGAQAVAVACDSEDIVKACGEHGIQAILTNPDHPTGTDRLSEAVAKLGLADDEIVVNVQGDEPLIPPAVIASAAAALDASPDCAIATAAHPIADVDSFLNPNVVKVVLNKNGRALDFTRAPAPWPRDAFKKGPAAVLPAGLPARGARLSEGRGAFRRIGPVDYAAEVEYARVAHFRELLRRDGAAPPRAAVYQYFLVFVGQQPGRALFYHVVRNEQRAWDVLLVVLFLRAHVEDGRAPRVHARLGLLRRYLDIPRFSCGAGR